MVSNKLKAITEQVADTQLANAIKDKSQQIWLAGLGAFSKAQDEGNKVFETLVKEGQDLQERTRKLADETVVEVTDRVSKIADTVSKGANAQWDKLEAVFEERVARSLGRLGVPTHKDLQQLSKRIEDLSKAVNELTGKKADGAKKAATKPAAE
jgi:poly(hydroxyalkanoate) granule-associated protein